MLECCFRRELIAPEAKVDMEECAAMSGKVNVTEGKEKGVEVDG